MTETFDTFHIVELASATFVTLVWRSNKRAIRRSGQFLGSDNQGFNLPGQIVWINRRDHGHAISRGQKLASADGGGSTGIRSDISRAARRKPGVRPLLLPVRVRDGNHILPWWSKALPPLFGGTMMPAKVQRLQVIVDSDPINEEQRSDVAGRCRAWICHYC